MSETKFKKTTRLFDWLHLGVLVPANPKAVLGVFKSLRHRKFLIYFLGLGVSMNGSWIQQLAMGWLGFSMTHSVFMRSLAVFLSQIPTLFLTPFTGVVSDRFDRRWIIFSTQAAMMLHSATLAVLTLTGVITMPMIFALCLFQGVVISFDAPARQSFYVFLVPKEDLSNAIAMNSAVINGMRFLGPAIGGVMVAAVGEGVCFLVNSLSYLAILFSLLIIKTPHVKSTFSAKRALADVREGMEYAIGTFPIRALVLLLGVVCFCGYPFQLLLPAFAKGELGGNSELLGTLMSFIGAGTLCAALYLAARKSVYGLGRVVIVASLLFGTSLILVSFVRIVPVVCVLCFCIGFSMISIAASSNTMLQALVDEEKRGRIMSIYSMVFFGVPPVGSLAQGWLAKQMPMSVVVFASGVLCIAGGLVFEYFRPQIRSCVRAIYAKKGIVMPEIANALQSSNSKHT